jgi:hypothetical protein
VRRSWQGVLWSPCDFGASGRGASISIIRPSIHRNAADARIDDLGADAPRTPLPRPEREGWRVSRAQGAAGVLQRWLAAGGGSSDFFAIIRDIPNPAATGAPEYGSSKPRDIVGGTLFYLVRQPIGRI